MDRASSSWSGSPRDMRAATSISTAATRTPSATRSRAHSTRASWTRAAIVSAYGRYAYTFQDSDAPDRVGRTAAQCACALGRPGLRRGREAGLTVLSYGGVALQPIAGIDWLRLDRGELSRARRRDLGLDVDPEVLESTTARFGGAPVRTLVMERSGRPGARAARVLAARVRRSRARARRTADRRSQRSRRSACAGRSFRAKT